MTGLQKELRKWFIILLLLLFAPPLLSGTSLADEMQIDPSAIQNTSQYYKSGLVLQNIRENTLIIDGEMYIFDSKTLVESYDAEYPVSRIKAIPYPALVNIVYQTYTQQTEAVPYQPGTRVVERIIFLQKIESDVQNSKSGKQD